MAATPTLTLRTVTLTILGGDLVYTEFKITNTVYKNNCTEAAVYDI